MNSRLIVGMLVVWFLVPHSVLVASSSVTADRSAQTILLAQAPVTLGEELNGQTQVGSFRDYIRLLYAWGARFAISLSILVVIWSGYLYMSSGGNPETTKMAKEYLTGAVVGIGLIFLSYLILNTLSPQLVNPTVGP